MKKAVIKNICAINFISLFMLVLSGCNSQNTKNINKAEKITIRFMSNLTDRSTGQGKIEQLLADNYTKEHPDIIIKFETYEDHAFQQKFKSYVSLNEVPDIYMTWTGAQFDLPAQISEELDINDFKDYGFIPGSLESRMRDGKLYGLPKNNDMYFLYYNKAIFAKNNIKIPTTFQELLSAVKQLRSKSITPCAMSGNEKWLYSGLYTDLYFRVNPSPKAFCANWDNSNLDKDPAALKAAKYYKELLDAGFFQDYFSNADYNTARNLFTHELSAMYYMGDWELGMAVDELLSKEFKDNLAVMPIPTIENESGGTKVLANWYGGGYSVSKNSKVKKEAIDFLKYFFKPENWAQLSWDTNACIAPQKFKLNGHENNLMKSVYGILEKSEIYQGGDQIRKTTPAFGQGPWDILAQFSSGGLSPEEFIKTVNDSLKKDF